MMMMMMMMMIKSKDGECMRKGLARVFSYVSPRSPNSARNAATMLSLIFASRSNASNAFLSSALAFRPMGLTFIIPLRNSTNVPLITGIFIFFDFFAAPLPSLSSVPVLLSILPPSLFPLSLSSSSSSPSSARSAIYRRINLTSFL